MKFEVVLKIGVTEVTLRKNQQLGLEWKRGMKLSTSSSTSTTASYPEPEGIAAVCKAENSSERNDTLGDNLAKEACMHAPRSSFVGPEVDVFRNRGCPVFGAREKHRCRNPTYAIWPWTLQLPA